MSPLGVLPIREAQARRLGLNPYQQLSPMLEKCALRLSANQSYQQAEAELEAQMGIRVSHSTLQRLGQRTEMEMPTAKQKVTPLSIDGGKVRVRHRQKGQASEWLEYKSIRLEALYYGAAFQNNPLLGNWVNIQPLGQPVVCLGDGHDGSGTSQAPSVVLKDGWKSWIRITSSKISTQSAAHWGDCDRQKPILAIGLFDDCKLDQARKFGNVLDVLFVF